MVTRSMGTGEVKRRECKLRRHMTSKIAGLEKAGTDSWSGKSGHANPRLYPQTLRILH